MVQYIAYRRVSTGKQGRSGLGLDAQASQIAAFVEREHGEIVATYTDVLSGADNSRPELAKAMAHARKLKAFVIVSKLDRLSRDAGYIDGLMKGKTKFVVAQFGHHVTPMMLGIQAVVAQEERAMISQRIKDALKAAKARGTILGAANAIERAETGRGVWMAEAEDRRESVREMITMIRANGHTTLKAIAAELTRHGIATPRERKNGINPHERMAWSATQVSRVLI